MNEKTINIEVQISDSRGMNIVLSRSHDEDESWFEPMNQFIAAMNAYGFIIKNRTISIDSDGKIIATETNG